MFCFCSIKYVTTLNNQEIKILDTRKTTPGIRLFEKYAVNIGGGYNHRMDLFDGTMFKDNHLTILKDMNYTLTSLRQTHPNKKIQIFKIFIRFTKKSLFI